MMIGSSSLTFNLVSNVVKFSKKDNKLDKNLTSGPEPMIYIFSCIYQCLERLQNKKKYSI